MVFCTFGFSDEITGNYLELLNLLGFRNKCIIIKEPMQFNRIIVPHKTMAFNGNWNNEFLIVIEAIIRAAKKNDLYSKITPYEKIYFSRTKLKSYQNGEYGESRIEHWFQSCGYEILYPERLSLIEQIFHFQNAREIASLSGTIPHNCIFAKPGLKFTMLNRTCIPNSPQIGINEISKVNCMIIDVYNRLTLSC